MRLNLNYGSFARWLRGLGLLAFCFFLVKGLAWIAVPMIIGTSITSCQSENLTSDLQDA